MKLGFALMKYPQCKVLTIVNEILSFSPLQWFYYVWLKFIIGGICLITEYGLSKETNWTDFSFSTFSNFKEKKRNERFSDFFKTRSLVLADILHLVLSVMILV
jgi:hypothetical protein